MLYLTSDIILLKSKLIFFPFFMNNKYNVRRYDLTLNF